jgi:acyl-CoA synthetase (AMP-forming)/AMP-acid ligase II
MRENGEKAAVISDKGKISFENLRITSNKFSIVLKNMGIEKGDRVGIFYPNKAEYLWLLLGIFKAGAVAVPLNFRYKMVEVKNRLEEVNAKLLIIDEMSEENIEKLASFEHLHKVYCLNAEHTRKAIETQNPDIEIPKIENTDDAMIIFTSGSTGQPKGCRITYRYLLAGSKLVPEALSLSKSDVSLNSLPFHHAAGSVDISLNTIKMGSTMVLMDDWNADLFTENIERYQVTWGVVVPTMLVDISCCKNFEKFYPGSLRFVVNTGAPLNKSILSEIEKKMIVLNGYGLTEADVIAILPIARRQDKRESVGKLLNGIKAKVVSTETGQPLPTNSIGTLYVKGDVLFPGYINDQANDGIFDEEGFFNTGDIGRIDEDGFLFLEGRTKEMIKTGAEGVHPAEVEDVILMHPKVREVCVLGVPDKRLGEAIGAVIYSEDNSISKEEIESFCKESEHLSNFKKPRYMIFIKEFLPRTTGLTKIDRVKVREEYLDRLTDSPLRAEKTVRK